MFSNYSEIKTIVKREKDPEIAGNCYQATFIENV